MDRQAERVDERDMFFLEDLSRKELSRRRESKAKMRGESEREGENARACVRV